MASLVSLFRRVALALGLMSVAGNQAAANPESRILTSSDVIMVSKENFESSETYDIILSNISVVNELFRQHLKANEISRSALTSYYVDYYLAQVNNGGFAQFVFNSGWNEYIVAIVRQGLEGMGARRHLALFDEGSAGVKALGEAGLSAYLRREFFGDNAARDRLNAINHRFYALKETEDLIKLNAAWLRRQPNLRVLSLEDLRAEVDRRAAAIPDRAERLQEAMAAEPRYTKLIRALCKASGQTLERITAGDPTLSYDGTSLRRLGSEELEGEPAGSPRIVWFFITDKGVHLMAEANGKAAMFDNETKSKIAEIEAPDEL